MQFDKDVVLFRLEREIMKYNRKNRNKKLTSPEIGIISTCHCGIFEGMYFVTKSLTYPCRVFSVTGNPRNFPGLIRMWWSILKVLVESELECLLYL